MIDNISLCPIRTGGVTRMASPIHPCRRVLIKDAVFRVLCPTCVLHWITARQFQHTDTVERRVYSGSRVEDEILTGLWVGELLWAFISRETRITTVWNLLPWFFGD